MESRRGPQGSEETWRETSLDGWVSTESRAMTSSSAICERAHGIGADGRPGSVRQDDGEEEKKEKGYDGEGRRAEEEEEEEAVGVVVAAGRLWTRES